MLKNLFPLSNKSKAQISYRLFDNFTTDRAAGSINGTQAEPVGGVRTVTDTLLKLSMSGGQLVGLIGGAGEGNPGIWYPSVSKISGLLLMLDMPSLGNVAFGFDGNTATAVSLRYYLNYSGLYAGGTVNVGTLTANAHKYAIVGRAPIGGYFFVKGGAYENWTLVWIDNTVNITPYYPAIVQLNAATFNFIVDNLRIPDALWIPNPIAYDTFTRADGAAGSTEAIGPEGQAVPALPWSGGTISDGLFVSTPAFGANLITNGGFATDTVWTKGTGWTIGSGVAAKAAGTQSDISQATGVVNNFYEVRYDVLTMTVAGSFFPVFGASAAIGRQTNTAPVIGTTSSRWQLSSTTQAIRGSVSVAGTIDNVVVREISKSSLFKVLNTATQDVFAEVAFVLFQGTSAGLVINLDDETNPQNYVIAWHDGINAHLDKCVGGVLTSLISTAQAYIGNFYIKVSKSGTKYRLYYNNTLIGTEQTITDAGVISNTKHGIFSTNAGNTFNNFALYARGTGGEYSALDQF